MSLLQSDTATATVRTTVNTTLLTALAALAYKVFGWEVTVDDLLPFTPLIIPIVAVFYRLSLLAAETWPAVGFLLFGTPRTPNYPPPPPPNGNDAGRADLELVLVILAVAIIAIAVYHIIFIR